MNKYDVQGWINPTACLLNWIFVFDNTSKFVDYRKILCNKCPVICTVSDIFSAGEISCGKIQLIHLGFADCRLPWYHSQHVLRPIEINLMFLISMYELKNLVENRNVIHRLGVVGTDAPSNGNWFTKYC